jgi:hypothetical protein
MASIHRNPQRAVSQPVRLLIERHLRSATEIEVLLLLHRSPETFWTPTAAASVVGAGEQEVRAHFNRFEAAGLVERGRHTDAVRFSPAEEEDRGPVAELAEAYQEKRDDVLRIVTGSLSQITAFSDAFRLPGR